MAKSMATKTDTKSESTAKKTSTKKATTEALVDAPAKKEVKPKKEVKVEKEYRPDDTIKCVSMTHGELIMRGMKTDLMYRWSNYGDITYVEYQDLYAAKSRRSDFIYSPLFIIDDEALLSHSRWADVKEFYDNMYSYDDINAILNLDNASFRNVVSQAPAGLKKAIEIEMVTQLEEGTFDSLQKIKIVDEICGTDLKCYVD